VYEASYLLEQENIQKRMEQLEKQIQLQEEIENKFQREYFEAMN